MRAAAVNDDVAVSEPAVSDPVVLCDEVIDVVAVSVPNTPTPAVAEAEVIDDVAVMFPKIAEPMFAIATKSEPTSDALVPVAFTNDRFWM